MAKRIYIAHNERPYEPVSVVCDCGKKTTFGVERDEWPRKGQTKVYKATCDCGEIRFGSNEKGWYVEVE